MLSRVLLLFIVIGFLGCTTTDLMNSEAATSPSQNAGNASISSDKKGLPIDTSWGLASGIYFLNSRLGWALCSSGRLCNTVDGGNTWKIVGSQNPGHISAILFVNEKQGYALSDEWDTPRRLDIVLKTADGGETWREVLSINSPISSMSFADAENGVVCARWNPLNVTRDGGKTWEEIVTYAHDRIYQGELSEGLGHLVVLDRRRAWGFGGGIWYSDDGMKTWQAKIGAGEVGAGLIHSSFVSEKNVWIVGHNSQIWRMIDGEHWERIGIPASLVNGKRQDFTFYRVMFITDKEGWVTADAPGAVYEGILIHTKDGGKTWAKLYGSSNPLTEINFLTPQKGFALDSDNHLLKTSDGGKTWSECHLIAP